jgi:hypothetical protein
MNTRWGRRDAKKTGAWYKKYLANNRKSLEIIIQARKNRLEKKYGEKNEGH